MIRREDKTTKVVTFAIPITLPTKAPHLESAYASFRYTELIASALVAAASLLVAIECRIKVTHLKCLFIYATWKVGEVEEAAKAPAPASAAPVADASSGMERQPEDAIITALYPQKRASCSCIVLSLLLLESRQIGLQSCWRTHVCI